ncbi:MAG: Coenzyme F420 hydrogenase/dehydrogenase, beta subunit C-terminal domain [Verrucomicrobiota bacterium]|nr:Coenzyme F420 hydrogenase/dehydrogenase, beta subunit C-terminal domain [Verrucomicrobiota bacterium]
MKEITIKQTLNRVADIWEKFEKQVISPRNCTHCGLCVGLNPGNIIFNDSDYGPHPILYKPENIDLERLSLAWTACPGRGVPYLELDKDIFQTKRHPLMGVVQDTGIAFSANTVNRKNAASGGVITEILIHLLEVGEISGAIVLQQGRENPEYASPLIATTSKEILKSAQSIYAVTPILNILPEIKSFNGTLAMVGLPDQIAAIRMLQATGFEAVQKIKYFIGPYVGTNMYQGAIRSFLKSHGVSNNEKIQKISWREGEWPGYLEVKMEDGRVFQAEKFYYNYLIPFFICKSCLITPDFTNELTDISVGDAWAPNLESKGEGYSVVITRSSKGKKVIDDMVENKKIEYDPVPLEKAMNMHGHMLDLKKRGTFIRLFWQKTKGKPIPYFGYYPANIRFSRKLVEFVLRCLFTTASSKFSRWLVTLIPQKIIGPLFNILRKSWKHLSKPTKRKGLRAIQMSAPGMTDRWQEIKKFEQKQGTIHG